MGAQDPGALRVWLVVFCTALLFGPFGLSPFFGCAGYRLRRSYEESVLSRQGIRRIYIAPVANQTYKAGIDHVVYNEMLRALAAFRQADIVAVKEVADAILYGQVDEASFSVSALTSANRVFPQGVGSAGVPVATEYKAVLRCSFRLIQRGQSKEGQGKKLLWATSLVRSKPFPGNNQIGVFGTTSALINDSEFDRALKELAESMMADLNESMLGMF